MTALAFDLQRLHNDIDQERQRQDLSWTALSRQVRVAASTIRRYAHAEEAEADGVLAIIQWLNAAPRGLRHEQLDDTRQTATSQTWADQS